MRKYTRSRRSEVKGTKSRRDRICGKFELLEWTSTMDRIQSKRGDVETPVARYRGYVARPVAFCRVCNRCVGLTNRSKVDFHTIHRHTRHHPRSFLSSLALLFHSYLNIVYRETV